MQKRAIAKTISGHNMPKKCLAMATVAIPVAPTLKLSTARKEWDNPINSNARKVERGMFSIQLRPTLYINWDNKHVVSVVEEAYFSIIM